MKATKNKKPALLGNVWIDFDELDQLSYRGVCLNVSEKSPIYIYRGVNYWFDSGNPIADLAAAADKIRDLGVRRKNLSFSSECMDFVSAGINYTYNDAVQRRNKALGKEWANTDFLSMRYTTPEERSEKIGFILDVIKEYEDDGEFDEAEQLRTSLVKQIGLSREIEQAYSPEQRAQKNKH